MAIRGVTARSLEFLPDPRQFVARGTAEAEGVSGISMQLDDVGGRDPGLLVQIVDVLRDHRRRLPGLVEAREREMPPARPRTLELVLHRKAPAPGLIAHLLACHEGIERDRLHPRPDAAWRAEIGNAALGRDSGPRERQNGFGVLD